MDRKPFIPVLLLLLGLVIGYRWLAGDDQPAKPSEAPVTAADAQSIEPSQPRNEVPELAANNVSELDSLRQAIARESRARQKLEDKIELLSRQIASLQRDHGAATATVPDSAEPAGTDDDAWFNEQALIDSGMDSVQASQLRILFEQIEMERMQLRDRSIREDWSRDRLAESMHSMAEREQSLKQELGEQAYDAYLYASGRPNRVAVTSVLETAQAGQAGVQPGDHILRYDDQRIYSWQDLREATTLGGIDQLVTLQVERDGDLLEFYLNGGPLGIRMNSIRVAP